MPIVRHANGGAGRPAKPRSKTRVLLLPLIAALGVAGFVVAGSIAQSATGTGATVSLGKTKLGRVLVDSAGHTLYLFRKDKHGTSACNGSCAKFWPPLLSHRKASVGPTPDRRTARASSCSAPSGTPSPAAGRRSSRPRRLRRRLRPGRLPAPTHPARR